MRPNDIRAQLRKQPFEPLRLFVSDGATYDIRHPELAMVGQTEVIIATEVGKDDLPARFGFVDPIHITRIEPINGTSGRSSKRKNPRRGK